MTSKSAFRVQLFESPTDKRPSWTGELDDLMKNNEDLDPKMIAAIKWLRPGQSETLDMGAGGTWKIRRVASESSFNQVKTASRYRLRYWTGPVAVKQIAAAVEKAGYKVTEGTEDIYVDSEGSDAIDASENFLDDLRKHTGKTFGLKMREHRRLASFSRIALARNFLAEAAMILGTDSLKKRSTK